MSSSSSFIRTTRLPQRGFSGDVDFESLSKDNKFLFRVHTPKERSPFADDSEPFFVAPRFDELFNRSPVDVPSALDAGERWSYAEVEKHMDWTTRSSSCYISASFSFSWAIWEAVKRYHMGVKKDIQIAIIDAALLDDRAATAVQLLDTSPLTARDEQFWKWHRFSEDSQSVLVYGMVPRTAVLGSIPLLQILRKMPSYFLRKDVQIIEGNPLAQVSWDYTNKKHTYRQFCQSMRKVFATRPMEARLRDSTAGAVRLALSFLRPSFHNLVLKDFDRALSYLRTLTLTISEWPGSQWVQDHAEIRQIVESMVLALGEELRDKYAQHNSEEVSRLQVVIDGLEETLRTQTKRDGRPRPRTRFVLEDIAVDSDGDCELEILEESEDPTLVSMPAPHQDDQCERQSDKVEHDRPSLAVSVSVVPHIAIAFQTPITPPDSPSVPNTFTNSTCHTESAETATAQIAFEAPPVGDCSSTSDTPALNVYQVFSPSTVRSPGEFAPISVLPTPPLSGGFVFPSGTRLGDDEVKSTEDATASAVLYPAPVNDVDDNLKSADFKTAVAEGPSTGEDAKESKPEDESLAESGTHMSTAQSTSCPYDEERHGRQGEDDEEAEHDDDDKTRAGDSDVEDLSSSSHYRSRTSSVSNSWVAIRHRRISSASRPILSPRSSITSIATLWEPMAVDMPLKRMSLAGFPESHDAVPTLRSLGVMSRTVSFSFSDFSPPRAQPLALIEDVDPAQVALPPSPSPSVESLPSTTTATANVSRSTSSHFTATNSISTELDESSSSCSSIGSDAWLPLITPLPPSPELSSGSLPSSTSISRTSSSTSSGSLSSTLEGWERVHSAPRSPSERESSEKTPVQERDTFSIIPPKPVIRLLSPLPGRSLRPHHDHDNDGTENDSIATPIYSGGPRRAGSHVGETASYIVTGFLVGAFLTLFLFSTQRRTLIHLT